MLLHFDLFLHIASHKLYINSKKVDPQLHDIFTFILSAMCGIFGYKGKESALPILKHGLERLEYRGYDSAGILVMNESNGTYELCKAVGKVSALEPVIQEKLPKIKPDKMTLGIAHTRRATHGAPALVNTHPHCDEKKEFFVVHNGIIENHVKLKKQLQKENHYGFYSDTDTEVIPALLAKHRTGDLLETVEKVLPLLHGAYALLITSTHTPKEIVAVKRGSPLIFGIHPQESAYFFSSDLQALSGYATNIIHLKDGELVHIAAENYTIKSEGEIVKKQFVGLDTKAMQESKGDYATFMLKEIFEQPAIISRAFKGRVDFANNNIYSNSLEHIKDLDIHKVIFVGCGTSYNAGALGAKRMQDLVGIDASAEIASEYIYKTIDTKPTTLHVFLSQSGETADSIEVLKHIQAKKGHTFGIVNVVGSTIATMTDCGFFLRAGFEIGVASTKAYTAQLIHILFLVLFLGRKHSMDYSTYTTLLKSLQDLPGLMKDALCTEKDIKRLSGQLSTYKHFFFLGRHYQANVADEASLKLKEISYIHSESYPAGELKHGPLALIDENFPSVLLSPHDHIFEQNMSSLAEIQSRQGKVLVVSDHKIDTADWFLQIPSAHIVCMPFVTTITMQLLSYHIANNLGRDIDKPRNLAKSVTVR